MKGEKYREVPRRKLWCHSIPSLVTMKRGKPFLEQEQIFRGGPSANAAGSLRENGRSLEVVSNHDPREMVIRFFAARQGTNKTRLTVLPDIKTLRPTSGRFCLDKRSPLVAKCQKGTDEGSSSCGQAGS